MNNEKVEEKIIYFFRRLFFFFKIIGQKNRQKIYCSKKFIIKKRKW
jgi:hypothetical protein